jgi:Tfp pilus assembly protein PilN
MIKINLASKKKSALISEQASERGVLSSLGKTRLIDLQELKGLPLRKFLLPLAVGFLAMFTIDGLKEDQLKKLNARIITLTKESESLHQEFNKTKTYEEIKKNLDADEIALRTKIETVKKLVLDRINPPKILLVLSKSIPDEVWLSEFSMQGPEVVFKGSSLGFTQISDFMKNLGESIFFQDLNLKSTQQVKTETGHEIATFELSAKRRTE